MSVREVVGGLKEVKITARQLLHVGSIGAAQHLPPLPHLSGDGSTCINQNTGNILKSRETLLPGCWVSILLQFNFLHRLIRNRKHHCAGDCWVSSQRSRREGTRCNLGFTIWRCRKRSPNCCCACYYWKCFQRLSKSLCCQVGVAEGALGMLRPLAPTTCLQNPKEQPLCKTISRAHGADLGSPKWYCMKDPVGWVLWCTRLPETQQNVLSRWGEGTGSLQKISTDLCRQLVSSYWSHKHFRVGIFLSFVACKSPLQFGCSVNSNNI